MTENQTINTNKMKIQVIEDNKQLMAMWPSSDISFDAQFCLTNESMSSIPHLQSCAIDSDNNITFNCDHSINKNSLYYVAKREGNLLKVSSVFMYQMVPMVQTNTNTNTNNGNNTDQSTPLSKKEQSDEVKEKFGSRKTKRSLINNKAYGIHFDDNDMNDVIDSTDIVDSQTDSINSTNSTDTSLNGTVDILPKRNINAETVESVYQFNDLVDESEIVVIERHKQHLLESIDNSFISNQITEDCDHNIKLIAIYLNLISKLFQLKANELRKVDPMPELHYEIKEFLFNRYSFRELYAPNRYKFVISDKEKDRILVHTIILSLMLYNYKPLEMELIQTTFKIPLRQIRRISELVGCYTEMIKNASGVNKRYIILKLPLNTLKESKKARNKRKL